MAKSAELLVDPLLGHSGILDVGAERVVWSLHGDGDGGRVRGRRDFRLAGSSGSCSHELEWGGRAGCACTGGWDRV